MESSIIALKEYLGSSGPWKNNRSIVLYAGPINDPNIDDGLKKSANSLETYIQSVIPGINISGMILGNVNGAIVDLEKTRKLLGSKDAVSMKVSIKNAMKAMAYRMSKAQTASMDDAADMPKETADYPGAMPKVTDGQVSEVLQGGDPDLSQQIGKSEPQILPKGEQALPKAVAQKTLDDRIIELMKKF